MCSEEIAKEIVNACSSEGPTEYVDTEPWLSKDADPVTESKVTTLEFLWQLLSDCCKC